MLNASEISGSDQGGEKERGREYSREYGEIEERYR